MKSEDIFQYTSSNNNSLIGVARQIINLKTQEITGILLLTLPIDELLDILTKDLPYDNKFFLYILLMVI